ncbi:MAG: cytochrome c1 [Limnobacter sp.]|nr:cytochrome c1 [Limnobacter sp.]
MKTMKKLFVLLALVPALVWASGGGYPLDKAPDLTNDLAALQRGARLFVNYCLNCHSAQSMRYNRLADIGLTDAQIRNNLILTDAKVGDTMNIAMRPEDAKKWFGAAPPDLSVIARSRASGAGAGADYLYTYLRTYYQDPARATGWNNLAFPNAGMPHVLWQLQGVQKAVFAEHEDPHHSGKASTRFVKFETVTPGTLTRAEYDQSIADLTSFLVYMGEPVRADRFRLGVIALIFLGVFTVFAWRLNASYWKDIH